jgi:glycosyltransferase involved in cell wall biosynthesis
MIIPGKTEKYFKKTIQEVLKQATGDIEIFAATDGYPEPLEDRIEDPRVIYINTEPSTGNQKRHLVNMAVAQSTGEYIMTLDAHCMIGLGFDDILKANHQPNWVQIPRRVRLDAENWCVQQDERLPIDYEYWKWQDFKKGGIHGYKWDSRTLERMNIAIDDTITFQGSCYFLTREYFDKLGLMQIEGFGGFTQEAEEIALKTHLDGGRVITNKLTWYAHLHKGKKYGRMYNLNWEEKRKGDDYAFDIFVNKNRDQFVKIVERFSPLPGWPKNWKEYLK